MQDTEILHLQAKLAEQRKQNRSHKLFITCPRTDYVQLLSIAYNRELPLPDIIKDALRQYIRDNKEYAATPFSTMSKLAETEETPSERGKDALPAWQDFDEAN